MKNRNELNRSKGKSKGKCEGKRKEERTRERETKKEQEKGSRKGQEKGTKQRGGSIEQQSCFDYNTVGNITRTKIKRKNNQETY